jgi:hypothetical protein
MWTPLNLFVADLYRGGVRCLSRALEGVENIIIFSARRKSNINSI